MKLSSLTSLNKKRILISRTDGIGDVVLTLPMAGLLKAHFPECEIIFLGCDYTLPVIQCSQYIDQVVSWDSFSDFSKEEQILAFKKLHLDAIFHVFPKKEIANLALASEVPLRIGTSHRIGHWNTCNYLIPLSRKNSIFHEAELNLQLMRSFTKQALPEKENLSAFYGLSKIPILEKESQNLLSTTKPNIILHPFTKGSAREWGLENFYALANLLQPDFRVFISGSEKEGNSIRSHPIMKLTEVIDITGKFQLNEFIAFINQADGLIASSTGPLHIAAALGKFALGLYPPIRPMHPGRWAPIGQQASFIVEKNECNKCRNAGLCVCMKSISPEKVMELVLNTFPRVRPIF